ncbi:MFS transporter [Spirillospora sp. CA-294931]|uniref:MFS transporter n=1 Tax=Spirillospora sp. CA-294931 TaxID=3240042 RepID=UPI003D8B9523
MDNTPVSNARKWGTFAIGALMGMVPPIDMTALNLAVPQLSADLDPSATQILWIADAYGFALAALLITMGGIGDRIGHKRMLLGGAAMFAVASAITAYAPTAELLIASRALLGVAGAALMPSGLALVRRVFTDPKERTMAVGVFFGIGGLSVGLGPVLGGALLDHFWWGSVFMINVPIMTVAVIAGFAVLPESRNLQPGRIDLLSLPLSAAGVLGPVYAIKEAADGGVTQGRVAVAALVGVLTMALFVRRQIRLDDPLVDVRLFRRPAFAGAVSTNMFAMFALVAQSLIFSMYFQLVLGWSPLKAGLAGLPGALAAMVGGAVLAPPMISVIGRARAVTAGLGVAAVAFALFLQAGVQPDYPALLVPMLMSGLGMGLAMTVTADTVLASVPQNRAGAASALSETSNELGGALGMAVLGSVLNAVYRDSLTLPADSPPQARDSLASALQATAALPPEAAAHLTTAAREAFVDGMHAALFLSAAFAALIALASLYTLRTVPKVIPDPLVPAKD